MDTDYTDPVVDPYGPEEGMGEDGLPPDRSWSSFFGGLWRRMTDLPGDV